MQVPNQAQLFIALYYKQISADIKIYNYTIKTSIASPEMPKARANKTAFNIMPVHFDIISRKLDIKQYDT